MPAIAVVTRKKRRKAELRGWGARSLGFIV
jgi:hypothetical protein